MRVNLDCITKSPMTKAMKRDAQFSIRMPSEMVNELKELAEAERRTLANYIVVTLEQHLAAKKTERTTKKVR